MRALPYPVVCILLGLVLGWLPFLIKPSAIQKAGMKLAKSPPVQILEKIGAYGELDLTGNKLSPDSFLDMDRTIKDVPIVLSRYCAILMVKGGAWGAAGRKNQPGPAL